ncbi:MAG: Arc family DNA-binding protein [Actinomycetota bacterium]|nr:Arc family DNA-binding protein [Actinomycetota bacterium]MDH5223887.1 Arc family DNA-binding protein [Actinomycetota bacterium]MDH5313448.1 Arc family DNA-binding protein [Actinomycetota bacterium]
METGPFLDAVETDLEALATGDDAAAGARIVGMLRSSLQLRLFDAMGQAALELSEQMTSGHVEVRLAGRDVELVYVHDEPAAATPLPDDVDGGTARLTLRMPESLKAQVERAADREGRSTNAWLVAAVKRALDHRGRKVVGTRLTGYGQG